MDSGILAGMTDIHTHLLPGVDDGIKTEEESWNALQYLGEVGVRRVYLTPHIINEYPTNDRESLRDRFQVFIGKSPVKIPELRLAAEYMLDSGFALHLENGLLTLTDGQVLLETSYLSPPPMMEGLLIKVREKGYIPLIAHPERYGYLNRSTVDRWLKVGCRFQLDLFSFAGLYGEGPLQNAKELLMQNRYDYAASDIHSLSGYLKSISTLCMSAKEKRGIRGLVENTMICF